MFFSSNFSFTFNNNVYVIFFCSYISSYFLAFFALLLKYLPQLGSMLEKVINYRPALVTKSFYIFSKYNFFNSYNFKSIYIYLMKFL